MQSQISTHDMCVQIPFGNHSLALSFLSHGTITQDECVYTPASLTQCSDTLYYVNTNLHVHTCNNAMQSLLTYAVGGDVFARDMLTHTASNAVTGYFETPNAKLTEEQLKEIEESNARRAAAWKSSNNKAINLLWNHLNRWQKKTLLNNGWFNVVSNAGQKYRIMYALHGNVVKLSKHNKVLCVYCGHMGADIPIADTLLSQKLMLKHMPHHYEEKATLVNPKHNSWCVPDKKFREIILEAIAFRQD